MSPDSAPAFDDSSSLVDTERRPAAVGSMAEPNPHGSAGIEVEAPGRDGVGSLGSQNPAGADATHPRQSPAPAGPTRWQP